MIFYQNISYSKLLVYLDYFSVFIDNNLDQHLEKFLKIIEEKCLGNVENLFREESNILLLSLKKSRKSLIEIVFNFYLTHKDKFDTDNSLINMKKMNVFHLLVRNKTLNIVFSINILG